MAMHELVLVLVLLPVLVLVLVLVVLVHALAQHVIALGADA